MKRACSPTVISRPPLALQLFKRPIWRNDLRSTTLRIAMLLVFGASWLLSFTPDARGDCAGPESCICPFDEATLIVEATVVENKMFRVDRVVRRLVAPMTSDGGTAQATQSLSIDATPSPVPEYVVGDEFAIDIPVSPLPSPRTRWLVGLHVGRWQTALPLDGAGHIVCGAATGRIAVEQLVSALEGEEPCWMWARKNLMAPPCDDTSSSLGCSHARSRAGNGSYCILFIAVAALIQGSCRRRRRRGL